MLKSEPNASSLTICDLGRSRARLLDAQSSGWVKGDSAEPKAKIPSRNNPNGSPPGGRMTYNADGSIRIGENITVRKSRLAGVFVIANDEDEAFVEMRYVDEVIQALKILRCTD